MNQSVIELVLLEQRESLDMMRHEKLVERVEEKRINLKSRLAQVVIGVRRSGKSTLCFNTLERAGVNYAYVNFDDERFATLSADDLNQVLECLYRIYGQFEYLFLDEIQNVDGWPLFVNRLLRQRMHLVVTGSNAKLLSGELATHLTGRHHTIELFPFSFRDWCNVNAVDIQSTTTLARGLLAKAYDEYMRIGGFPELAYETDAKEYVTSLVNDIIEQDIHKRFKVKNIQELKVMAQHVLNEVPTIVVQDALMQVCGIKSDHTLVKYLSYLVNTYLITAVSRYSIKSRQRVRGHKYYAIDVALMDKRKDAFVGPNLGWRLETIVYLELSRRYSGTIYDIYYHKDKTYETDFIVCEGTRTEAVYQVSYDISSEKTRAREIRGCIAGAKLTKCDNIYLITDHEYADEVVEGYTIKIRPAYQWLLQE